MKIQKYLAAFFPPAVMVMLLALPLILTIYFLVSQHASVLVAEYTIGYYDTQNDWFGRVVADQSWIEWFNRAMDFVFWGMLAALVLSIVWAIGATKAAIQNHHMQKGFVHFQQDRLKWHGHFMVTALLKVLLVALLIYSFFAIVGRWIPQLSVASGNVLMATNADTIKALALPVMSIYVFQYIMVFSVTIFRRLRVE